MSFHVANKSSVWAGALLMTVVPAHLWGADLLVNSFGQLNAALDTAAAGDRILLASGTYTGSIFKTGLSGVTLTSQDPSNPAILDAGGSGEVLHLSSATNVTVENLVFQNYFDNGINIDDGGNWPAGKSEHISLRRIEVRNTTAPDGNRDGIKLSGVDHFVVDQVQVSNWGTGGSAIDPVGSHFGLIENSIFTHDSLAGGSGIRPKGGSKDIQIRANLVQMNDGRAIQAGGSTGTPFFRFVPGDGDYEADEISVAGNLILGGESSVSWVNIDGGDVRHNYIQNPSQWVMRMLNENTGSSIVDTQHGLFADNFIVYDSDLARISNHDGPEVLEDTFIFARNQWFNLETGGPAGEAELQLPSTETDGIYGFDPQIDPLSAVSFSLDWGLWVVNPHAAPGSILLSDFADYAQATPGESGVFDPLAADPFIGDWSFQPLTDAHLAVSAQSQAFLAVRTIPEPGSAWLALAAMFLFRFRNHRGRIIIQAQKREC